jgi:nicotinamide mononucleotide transporter
MSLQGYYLIISILGWYWWVRGKKESQIENEGLVVTRLRFRTGVVTGAIFISLFALMWFILARFTDSTVSGWDAFITSLSIVATWMLARKIYEHWFLWVAVNAVSAGLFLARGLYPTMILYIVYGIMSFAGMIEWRKSLNNAREH